MATQADIKLYTGEANPGDVVLRTQDFIIGGALSSTSDVILYVDPDPSGSTCIPGQSDVSLWAGEANPADIVLRNRDVVLGYCPPARHDVILRTQGELIGVGGGGGVTSSGLASNGIASSSLISGAIAGSVLASSGVATVLADSQTVTVISGDLLSEGVATVLWGGEDIGGGPPPAGALSWHHYYT